MGDRDIPSVPITTLAGLTSLSDLLSELPISDSLATGSTSLNRSLLFHPRVAEEANNLLATRDDNLIGQLANAIEQTNSDHIELKDQYAQQSPSKQLHHEGGPLLLQAIHTCRPDVFSRPQTHQQQMLAQQQQKIISTSQTQVYNFPSEHYSSIQTHHQPLQQQQQVYSNQLLQVQQQPSMQQQQQIVYSQSPITIHHPNHPPVVVQQQLQQQSQPQHQIVHLSQPAPTNLSFQQQQQQQQQPPQQLPSPQKVIIRQQVINVQNIPYSNPSENHQLQQQQQQQQQLFQLQQQQQIHQQQQQNQNVIVTHQSVIQNQQQPQLHIQLPSQQQRAAAVDSHRTVIQQTQQPILADSTPPNALLGAMSARQGAIQQQQQVQQQISNHVPYQQNQQQQLPQQVANQHQLIVPQQPQQNVIHKNSNLHSASPNQHHPQQHLANNLPQQPQQQQHYLTTVAKQQSHLAGNEQSQLKNGSSTLHNHQYPQGQPPPPQQQQQHPNHLIKTPEAAPRNSEYLQQQQSKNLDSRGRPSPAQGTTAPETDPTQTSLHKPQDNQQTQAVTPGMGSMQRTNQQTTVLNRPRPATLGAPATPAIPATAGMRPITVAGVLHRVGNTNVPPKPVQAPITSIGVSGALMRAPTTTNAPTTPALSQLSQVQPQQQQPAPSPVPSVKKPERVNLKKLCRMMTMTEAGSISLKKCSIRMDRLDEQHLALMQEDLKKFSVAEPKLAMRLGLVKKSNEMIFSKMKEDERRYSGLLAKRRAQNDNTDPENMFSKPKLRRVERSVAPVVKKMSKEELMNTNTYQRFMSIMGKIFDQLDETEAPSLDDADEPLDCIPTSMLSNIGAEAAKLKARNAIEAIPENKLQLLITYAMRSIQSAKNLSGTELQDDLIGDECIEKILNAMEAALLICSIYTCKSTKFLQEDNIDAIIKFVQFQLRETVFPSYDPVYSVETKKKVDGKKAKKIPSYQQKGLSILYTKIVELGKLLVTMFEKFHFVDTIVIHASALGVEPFFVDNIETLQFVCLDLVTSIFQNEKYSHHRRNIVADILSSIDRLPHSKRNLRPYKLVNNAGNIQMMTALVLQLIQCAVVLPESLGDRNPKKLNNDAVVNSSNPKSADLFIIGKYDTALSIGGNFLATFLDKCKSRSSETDFRPLFENFIHDLLTTVNKPEWPASELLLSLLGTMLVKKMSDKGVEQSIRVVSLEYLGIVAARLRKDTVESRCKVRTMDSLIKYIKIEQEKEGDEYQKNSKFQLNEEEERTEFLQKILLDFLAANAQEGNIVWNHARHFYITQWYRDIIQRKKCIADGEKGYASRKKQAKKRKKYHSESDNSDGGNDSDLEEVKPGIDQELNSEIFRMLDTRKTNYLLQICPFGGSGTNAAAASEIKTYIDYSNANLIAQYLASKRSFSQSFDKYLQKIILVVREPVVAIRTRAMKCLGNIVEVDQMVLARKDMQMGVHQKLLDTAISVREAAVDLVGKYILSDPDLIDQYYEMISQRILDTGVSVRKRVIKILRDICIEYPEQDKIPDICVKMIRRVNDEEGIQKLVMDVFMTMWFTPCNANDKGAMDRKITQIIDVVCSSHETGTQGFDALLKSIFEPKENKEDAKAKKEIPKTLIKACQQIVDGLVDATMKLESSENKKLVGCITALHLFSKIQPQLLVNHAMTLEPYLNIRCQNAINYKFISSVAEILEQVVPLMEHPSDIFLADLESHLMMLIVTQSQAVVLSCVSCLSAVVNRITKNYALIRDCFSKFYYKGLVSSKDKLISDPSIPIEQLYRPQFRRSIYTVGLIMRYFDFKQPEVYGGAEDAHGTLPATICDEVYNTLAFFLSCSHSEICKETLLSMGNFCVKNYEYLTKPELRDYYNYLLTQETVLTEMKINVLKNILMYLTEEENKMVRNDKEWAKQAESEDLKEMGDVSSGMASRVIQIYLKEILRSFLHRDTGVRMWAMRVVEIVLRQGLVHPVQIVPYLICLSTDPEKEVAHSADRHLQEIDKQYPGFVNMKSHAGMQYSYELQVLLQTNEHNSIVRGFRIKDPQEPPTALNGFLYTLLRNTKPQRRALVQSITKQFDDGKISLKQMLYLADNLAYFPYVVQDEPLYIIHHIDVLISVTGTNLLASFREGLKPPPGAENSTEQPPNPLEDDDDDDQDVILSRLPEDTTELQNCITSAQGCMLLLILKQHLKDIYGITDCKISRYSPSEAGKIYDKTMQRRSNSLFDPKATIALLNEKRSTEDVQEEKYRIQLVQRYLDFKQLMLRLDPDDPELLDEDDRLPAKGSEPNSATNSPVKQAGASGDASAGTTNHNSTAGNTTNAAPSGLVNNVHNTSSSSTPAVTNKTPKPTARSGGATNASSNARKVLPSRSARKKRRKVSTSEEEESDASDMDYD
ncbi:nipped-B protein [Sabethes cyaneus]|uniref:nipped-B protein n=1 Tax=Sabethes cyaneus TaxID=53552 RepID=UPI00237EC2FE|nr:nipped-B protein [Sabethes cyaneus]